MVDIQSRSLRIGERAWLHFLNFSLAPKADPRELVELLRECDKRHGLSRVARQAFFVPDRGTREAVKAVVDKTFDGRPPPTTVILQPPADGGVVAAEMWAFDVPEVEKPRSGIVALDGGGARWVFAGGIEDREGEPFDKAALAVLAEAKERFGQAGMSFSDSVRLWYYVGGILGRQGRQSRYGLFNRARNEFYSDKWHDLCLSPASTGIGTLSHGIAFEGLAMRGSGGDYACAWIDNPLQTPPFKYDIELKRHGQTPSFSRAAAIRLEKAILIFISGTASVRNSEVVNPDDIAGQTAITLDNIATLIGDENLRRYGFDRGAGLADMMQYRVYVRRPDDVDRVRTVCGEKLGAIPHAEMTADVCWPEFMLEIEGVAAVPLSD